MSKSYTVNGKEQLYKCLKKASEEPCKVYVELNNARVLDLLQIISGCSSSSEITILYNLIPDEKIGILGADVAKTKDKVDLINRKLSIELINRGLNASSFSGIQLLNSEYFNNIKVFITLNCKKHTQYFHFTYNDGTSRDILADITDENNEICNVTLYAPREDILNNLYFQFDNSVRVSGLNCSRDLVKVINSQVSINSLPVWEAYKRSLFEINKHHINSNKRQEDLLYNIDKAELQFQSDGVNSLINILTKYGIAYLADSVGLGKTIIALRLLAKTNYSALVITPNEIVESQWKEYIDEPNDIFENNVNIHFCINSYQSLERFINTDSNYDIVIFDEAQNFRNMNTLRYEKAQEICAGKQVLLIGATPINNGISDIEAQLMLGLNENKSYDFGVGKIGEYFQSLRKMTNKSKKNPEEYKKAQKIAGNDIRNKIISKIMVRRTRKDIEKYYKSDIESGRLHFPEVLEPQIVKYSYTGTKLATTLDILSGYNFKYHLTYALYNPSRYLLNPKSVEKCVDNVENSDSDKQDNRLREINMTGLTKVRLIKLLDSSPEAFLESLMNMIGRIDDTISYLEGGISKSDYEQSSLFDNEYNTEELDNKSLYSKQYKEDLLNDRWVLYEIVKMWFNGESVIDGNIKLNKLIEILEANKKSKIVIFTEYVTTAQTLEVKLSKRGYKVLKVDGTDNKSKSRLIKDNFSIAGRLENNYDILISTNILSEGINLNRASVAINYDITWNPMIIIQRVGRLNRIDSKVRTISVYNFFPCDEMDSTILSESNIISKFALASYSIGTDDNYLVKSDSDDISASIMDYKQSIIDSISHNIIEESVDFRTVEFRYAGEANDVFSSKEELESLSKSSIFTSCKARENEVPSIMCIFSIDGKIITCKKDITGLYFINYNDFLDTLKSHREDNIYNSDFNFSEAKSIINDIKRQNGYTSLSNVNSKDLYKILDRLMDELDKQLDIGIMPQQRYDRYKRKLIYAKRNILNGVLNSYLCGVYKNKFNNEIKNKALNVEEQIKAILQVINSRFTEYTSEMLDYERFNVIAVVQII